MKPHAKAGSGRSGWVSSCNSLHTSRLGGAVTLQDIHLDEGEAITYRTKLQISFKYESGQ
jgi:hypothetical protein